MTRPQCTETGKQLLQELKTTLAQVDPAYAEEQLAYDQAAAHLPDYTFAEALETQFAAKLLYVTWQGFCWNLDCYRNPVNKLRLHTDYEELHGEYHFPALPQVRATEETIHAAIQRFTPAQQELARQMEDYYAYLETVGFKLGHLWGFQRGNAFFPMVIPGFTPDTAFAIKYARMVSVDIGFPIERTV